MNYKAILFDLDDTLLDFTASEDLALDSVYDRFFSHIGKETFKQVYKKINLALWAKVEEGHLRPEYVKNERFVQVLRALDMDCVVDPISHHYLDSLGQYAFWMPGAEEILKLLQGQCSIGVVTNGLTHAQEKKYQLCGLSKWCTSFLISEKVGVAKPDRKIFEMALKQVSAEPHETLMVGDSLASDYQGAFECRPRFLLG